MVRGALVLLAIVTLTAPLIAEETASPPKPFRDIPSHHWAAQAVSQITGMGIMKGYPDSTFKGDKPVTRYELAVALARFVEFINASHKPLLPSSENKVEMSKIKCPFWARSSVETLTLGEYLQSDSTIINDGAKPVTSEDLANALASVAARIIELDTPDSGAED
jgi:hypothetical protein